VLELYLLKLQLNDTTKGSEEDTGVVTVKSFNRTYIRIGDM
jgi:hypothetical protein